jgi:hypothetical protein
MELSLYTLDGKCLLQKQLHQSTFEFDLSAFEGVQFILKLKNKNQIEIRQVYKIQ